MRPTKPGAEILSGAKGSLSANASPTASTVRMRAALGEARKANGVPSMPSMLPREAARLRRAGALMERTPATAPRPRVRPRACPGLFLGACFICFVLL
jgi:hypothetical protein